MSAAETERNRRNWADPAIRKRILDGLRKAQAARRSQFGSYRRPLARKRVPPK
jgi:hypothetical protein